MLVVRCESNEIIDLISTEMKEYHILARINGAFFERRGLFPRSIVCICLDIQYNIEESLRLMYHYILRLKSARVRLELCTCYERRHLFSSSTPDIGLLGR